MVPDHCSNDAMVLMDRCGLNNSIDYSHSHDDDDDDDDDDKEGEKDDNSDDDNIAGMVVPRGAPSDGPLLRHNSKLHSTWTTAQVILQ